ncbi:hypothetical protein NF556_17935 [Ornithinimicrobium faecis]|uniref:Secreted protein n=1 Tax=Ornithinimicrobium faecis TaxID=2934158 RepID=A0ABY4YSV7_9MICO|nr:hypothetical protein [Ornithinimicrobium sp. HY1793]USQ79458.1 hypothetical protein NF556_17935 [Ornithinimicrobium sp. HY1793]
MHLHLLAAGSSAGRWIACWSLDRPLSGDTRQSPSPVGGDGACERIIHRNLEHRVKDACICTCWPLDHLLVVGLPAGRWIAR